MEIKNKQWKIYYIHILLLYNTIKNEPQDENIDILLKKPLGIISSNYVTEILHGE